MITVVLFALAVAAFVLSLALETARPTLAALLMFAAMTLIVVVGLRLVVSLTPEQARQTNALATIAAATAAVDANATEAALATLEARARAAATAAGEGSVDGS